MKSALHRLSEAGHVAYVVGGSVRDFLLGSPSKDHDIATSADPDELCKLFPRALLVGKAFGVIKVPTGTEPPLLEIATFRKDLDYTDYRHPKGVVLSSPVEDAQRRDFTVNSLFFDPKTSRIIDFTGGIEDLDAKLIRAIGDPVERFREDALRLLRAIRFQTRLGFQLHPETQEAIASRAKLITKVSAERIRDELTLMWTGPRPHEALSQLLELGLLPLILPEVQTLKGMKQATPSHRQEDVWSQLLRMLQCLAEQNPSRSNTLAWAAVLHEVGKPVEQIASRFKMSRADCLRIAAMVEDQRKFREVFQMRESTLQRFIREEHFEELLALHRADVVTSDGNLAYYEFCASRLDALKKAPAFDFRKLIDGDDLIQLGFRPGPEFSGILRVVEDLALERKLTTKEEALEYVVKNFVK